jgi:hypothetical protein
MAANRSEIAIRVFRSATELNLRTVAVFAKEDRFSIHRFKADEAYMLPEAKGPVGAYLDIEGVVAAAKEHAVDAIHPGYGFLSENAEFARACAREGILFVGPKPELLELMGDKVAARAEAKRLGVPTLPGTDEPVKERGKALKLARQIGFPLIIKAACGGGGRGMRVVQKEADLERLLDEAQNEALRAFGNAAVQFLGGGRGDDAAFGHGRRRLHQLILGAVVADDLHQAADGIARRLERSDARLGEHFARGLSDRRAEPIGEDRLRCGGGGAVALDGRDKGGRDVGRRGQRGRAIDGEDG